MESRPGSEESRKELHRKSWGCSWGQWRFEVQGLRFRAWVSGSRKSGLTCEGFLMTSGRGLESQEVSEFSRLSTNPKPKLRGLCGFGHLHARPNPAQACKVVTPGTRSQIQSDTTEMKRSHEAMVGEGEADEVFRAEPPSVARCTDFGSPFLISRAHPKQPLPLARSNQQYLEGDLCGPRPQWSGDRPLQAASTGPGIGAQAGSGGPTKTSIEAASACEKVTVL